VTLAELISVELAVPVRSESATLTSTLARAKRYIREADARREAWLERMRQEAAQHG
jgi:hypothetical protein